MGWSAYLSQRETDERRRKRERLNAERKADALLEQADKMRAKATKAQAAQNMMRRAERLCRASRASVAGPGGQDRVPRAGTVRPDAADGPELSKSYGSLEVFTDVDLAIDKGSRVVILGLNGAGKTTLLRILGRGRPAGHRRGDPGHGLKLGYYAQEHETLDTRARCWRTCAPRRRS